MSQRDMLRDALGIPPIVRTAEGNVEPGIEALALVCRLLSEPCRLFTIANKFGRLVAAASRIFSTTFGICTTDTSKYSTSLLSLSKAVSMHIAMAFIQQVHPCQHAGHSSTARNNTFADLVSGKIRQTSMKICSAQYAMGNHAVIV